jgi:Transposase
MGNGSGVSRGDRNRNARLERLRALVPVTNAIAGIDLAGKKQMVVVTDHDSKVIARRTFRCRAWDLGSALDWAAGRAAAAGWAGVTVSCEPTGHRWRVLGQLAADRSMPFVRVQPLVTSWARRTGNLTCDKTDEKDARSQAIITGLGGRRSTHTPAGGPMSSPGHEFRRGECRHRERTSVQRHDRQKRHADSSHRAADGADRFAEPQQPEVFAATRVRLARIGR